MYFPCRSYPLVSKYIYRETWYRAERESEAINPPLKEWGGLGYRSAPKVLARHEYEFEQDLHIIYSIYICYYK